METCAANTYQEAAPHTPLLDLLVFGTLNTEPGETSVYRTTVTVKTVWREHETISNKGTAVAQPQSASLHSCHVLDRACDVSLYCNLSDTTCINKGNVALFRLPVDNSTQPRGQSKPKQRLTSASSTCSVCSSSEPLSLGR